MGQSVQHKLTISECILFFFFYNFHFFHNFHFHFYFYFYFCCSHNLE